MVTTVIASEYEIIYFVYEINVHGLKRKMCWFKTITVSEVLKCFLCSFSYITDIGVYLLQTEIYYCRHEFIIAKLIIQHGAINCFPSNSYIFTMFINVLNQSCRLHIYILQYAYVSIILQRARRNDKVRFKATGFRHEMKLLLFHK